MEEIFTCVYIDCHSSAELRCLCTSPGANFCENHFNCHRKENRGVKHLAEEINYLMKSDENSNEICVECSVRLPILVCLCNNSSSLLCQECIGAHTSKPSNGHSLEPLLANEFIKSGGDISYYFNRKCKIQVALNEFKEVHNQLIVKKNEFEREVDVIKAKIEAKFQEGLEKFRKIDTNFSEIKDKLTDSQFLLELDQTDQISSILKEDSIENIKLRIQTMNIFSASLNTESIHRALENLLNVHNNYEKYTDKIEIVKNYYDENNYKLNSTVKGLFENVISRTEVKSVKNITIVDQKLGVQGAIDLSIVLSFFPQILQLDLSDQSIGPNGAISISSSLRSLINLKELSLGGNYIEDTGALSLFPSFSSLISLEELFLYKNKLSAVSAKVLSEAIPCLSNLKLISLNQNQFSDEGLIYLTGVIASFPNLEAIGLQNNLLNTKSGLQIEKIIRTLPNLTDLSLDDNKLRTEGFNYLIPVLSEFKGVLRLYARHNEIDEDTEEILKHLNPEHVHVAISYKNMHSY